MPQNSCEAYIPNIVIFKYLIYNTLAFFNLSNFNEKTLSNELWCGCLTFFNIQNWKITYVCSKGRYKQWTQGPRTKDPAYEHNRRPEDPAVRDTCSLANHCNIALTKQTLPLLCSLGELIEVPSAYDLPISALLRNTSFFTFIAMLARSCFPLLFIAVINPYSP